MGFGIAKFRTAKFSHCEIGIGSANLKFALRNGIWHCEISHCEIFALRNGIWHCEISHCEIFALRNLKLALRNRFWHCEMAFGIAKFRIAKFSHCEIGIGEFSHCEMGLRTVCENLFLLIFHACLPVFNCISLSSLFLRFSIEFWAC